MPDLGDTSEEDVNPAELSDDEEDFVIPKVKVEPKVEEEELGEY